MSDRLLSFFYVVYFTIFLPTFLHRLQDFEIFWSILHFFTYTARADGYFFKYALDIAFHWIHLHSTWLNKNFPLFMQKLKKKKRIGLILQRWWWWWWCRVQWEVHWVADKADVINPTLQGCRMWGHFNSGGSVAMMVVMVEHMMRIWQWWFYIEVFVSPINFTTICQIRTHWSWAAPMFKKMLGWK